MTAFVLVMMLAQDPGCAGEGLALLTAASARAEVLDLAGASDGFRNALRAGCASAELPTLYATGLLWAREASRQGGSSESLAPLREIIATLQRRALDLPATAEIVRVVLMAAAAAAQSERDEMALLLAHAIRLEALQHSANEPVAPLVSAHEIAGDLWLQVHRYEDARDAYTLAATRIGRTPRVVLGLARTASRLSDVATACTEYRNFIAAWEQRTERPSEVAEARTFVDVAACRRTAPPSPR